MLRTALAREERAMAAALADLREEQQALAGTAAAAAEIEARLRPLLRTARGRFLFLDGGGVGLLLGRLRQALEEEGTTRDRGGLAVVVKAAVLPLTRLLALCCRDGESAVAVGLLGGHPVIKRVMRLAEDFPYDDDAEEEEINEVAAAAEEAAERAAEVASRCSVVRGGFPLRTIALDEASTRESLQLPLRMCFPTNKHEDKDKEEGEEEEEEEDEVVALVTPIAARMGGQADTGFVTWPAATILARWLARHPSLIAGKRVMEVGAGLGLCGLVAGRWAREVLLTDYNLACLERLAWHAALSETTATTTATTTTTARSSSSSSSSRSREGTGGLNEEETTAVAMVPAMSRPGGVKVRWLDWHKLRVGPGPRWEVVDGGQAEQQQEDELVDEEGNTEDEGSDDRGREEGEGEEAEGFGRPRWGTGLLDVVIGSDVICDASCARGVAGLLAAALKPARDGGVAFITAPFPAHRYGVDHFPKELEAHGLRFDQEEVTDAEMLAGLPEAAYMRFHFFTIRKRDEEEEGVPHMSKCVHE